MKPVFNKLLEQSLSNPSDMMLEKFLAFKKSLMSFETSVASVKKALDGLLENDLDMADLVRLDFYM
jgi:Mg2+ and Co2+ transporter CorA